MKKIMPLLKRDSGRLAKKSGITLIVKIAGMGIGYILTFFVTKSAGSEAWGNYALAYAILQICSTIGQLGVDTASIRFVSQFSSVSENGKLKDYYIKAILIVIICSFIISIGLYLLSDVIAVHSFHKPYLGSYLRLIALGILPQTLIDLHAEMFKGLKKPTIFAFFMYVTTYLSAFLIVAFSVFILKTPADGWIAIKDTVIGLWIVCVIIIMLWHYTVKFQNFRSVESLAVSQIAKISTPMMISMSIVLIMGWTDTLMLGSLMNDTASLGIYNVALKITTTISLALMAVNSVSTPRYAEFFATNQMEKLKRVVNQSTKLVFYYSFPMCIICIAFPKQILGIFGNDFKAGAFSLIILSIGRFASSTCGSVGYILQMTGHEKIIQNIIAFACVLNIVLNYILIPLYGINGSAIATSASTITWNLIGVYYVNKKLNINTIYLPYFSIKKIN